ncbi:MAG: PEGA domain-containing protein [Calditrichaeota bacterium]|nr:MAG: PEGA domain-containing protein [Calditrichota bacterium]MBL1206502.1 PEGA domain-containing protein [Calditrichota bacterium]NOG46329.1 PEGA domain-containing protein [Calditrichota bacterium]
MKRNILFLTFLLCLSCGIKQPVEFTNNIEKAKIIIHSDPKGALIFLNDESTQKFTPDTLTVNPGNHKIQVALNGYQSDQDSFLVTVEPDSVKSIYFLLRKLNSFGELVVETTPANAVLIIDGTPQSKTTPNAFKLSTGPHTIIIKKNGYKDYKLSTNISENQQLVVQKSLQVQNAVLLESFANVSCDPCVPATENLESFSHNNNDSTFFILEYFANWPKSNDPFYQVAPTDVIERVMRYNIGVLPGVRVAGSWTDPYSLSKITDSYSEKYNEMNDEIGVSVSKLLSNDSLKVEVELFQMEEVANLDEMVLFCAITENNISFDSPPGSNGLKDFNWVFRGFLSDKKGDSFAITESVYSKSYSKLWNNNWDYSNIKVIAFLQNKNDKSIKYVSGQ